MRKFVVAIASLARLPNSSARGLPYPAGREGKEKGRERERKGEVLYIFFGQIRWPKIRMERGHLFEGNIRMKGVM